MKCVFCNKEVKEMIGSYGLFSCKSCYNMMMDYYFEICPKEILRLKKINEQIKALENESKEIRLSMEKELKELKENEE